MDWKDIIQKAIITATAVVAIDEIFDYRKENRDKTTNFILKELGKNLAQEDIKEIKTILYDNRK